MVIFNERYHLVISFKNMIYLVRKHLMVLCVECLKNFLSDFLEHKSIFISSCDDSESSFGKQVICLKAVTRFLGFEKYLDFSVSLWSY